MAADKMLEGDMNTSLIVWGFHWTHKMGYENKPHNMAKAAEIQR